MSQLYQFIPPLTDMLLQNVCFEDVEVLHNSIIFLKKTDVCYGKKETNIKLIRLFQQIVYKDYFRVSYI